MPTLPKKTNHRQIARADMTADDWHAALREMRAELKPVAEGYSRNLSSAADYALRALRSLESRAKDHARERIRQAGGAV